MIDVRINDNRRKFLRELAQEDRASVPKTAFGNDAEYAKYLQFRRGFVVVDDVLLQLYTDSEIRRVVALNRALRQSDYTGAMERATDRLAAKMQAFTSKLRPPVKPGGPSRPAHTGGWADRTTLLASSYFRRLGAKQKRYAYSGKKYA